MHTWYKNDKTGRIELRPPTPRFRRSGAWLALIGRVAGKAALQ